MNATGTGSAQPRRWGFRARLTALIALVFVAGGAALLGVQYLLTQQLFDTAIGTITTCVTDEGVSLGLGDSYDELTAHCAALAEVSAIDVAPSGAGIDAFGGGEGAAIIEQTAIVSREVLSGLLLWSIVTLAVFTAIAILAASWLSKRSFARIGQITETTKRITRDDLHQRLELPGPGDEIKELGDTIDTMLDRLQASFTQQERFITNASHELRTPLTTTRVALEVPLTQGLVPARLEPSIRTALAANERSEAIIAALLALARVKGRGAVGAPDDATDLAELAQEAVERHASLAEADRIEFTLTLRPAPVARLDGTILALAVDNLIDNAVKHNSPGGGVGVATGSDADSSWLEVVNTGATIGEEEARRLTEPFNRGLRTRTSATGTGERSLGLGLTLVESVVDAAGGSLSIAPALGGGLRVLLHLPPGPAAPGETRRR